MANYLGEKTVPIEREVNDYEYGAVGGAALEYESTSSALLNELVAAVKELAEFDPVKVEELFSQGAHAYSRAMDLAEMAHPDDPVAELRDWEDVQTAPLKPLTQQMFEALLKR